MARSATRPTSQPNDTPAFDAQPQTAQQGAPFGDLIPWSPGQDMAAQRQAAGVSARKPPSDEIEPLPIELMFEVPPTFGGYAPRRAEIRLTGPQAIALRLLTDSLAAEKTLDGRPVIHASQALAWLLEQIAQQLPEPVMDQLLEQLSR